MAKKEKKQEPQETVEAVETEVTQEPETAETVEVNPWEEKYNTEHDSYLRLAADYDNFRKRSQREKEALYAECKASVINALLPVADNFDRIFANPDGTLEDYKKGVEMTFNQLKEVMAKLGVEETGMGRVSDKVIKHQLVANKTPGTEDLQPSVKTGDDGLTLIEMAPFGVIGSITPSTNPSETVICNSIGMIAGGNAVVFNPHPNAKKIANYAVDLVNRAILEAGGPENLVVTVEKPTKEWSLEY